MLFYVSCLKRALIISSLLNGKNCWYFLCKIKLDTAWQQVKLRIPHILLLKNLKNDLFFPWYLKLWCLSNVSLPIKATLCSLIAYYHKNASTIHNRIKFIENNILVLLTRYHFLVSIFIWFLLNSVTSLSSVKYQNVHRMGKFMWFSFLN